MKTVDATMFGNAPVYDYTVPGYGFKTKALNDSTGVPWYYTQGGKWRNTQTRALSSSIPSYQTAAAAPAAPAQTRPPVDQGTIDALFPQTPQTKQINAFEPQNYQGSELYKFQKTEGLKDVNQQLASRGLYNSGAGLASVNKFLQELGGNEANRAQDLMVRQAEMDQTSANRQADVSQANAARLGQMMENEALRSERQSASAWDRIQYLVDTGLAQSPLKYGAGAANTAAGLYQTLAGVAGQATPGAMLLPSTPINYQSSDQFGIQTGAANSQAQNTAYMQFLQSLLSNYGIR